MHILNAFRDCSCFRDVGFGVRVWGLASGVAMGEPGMYLCSQTSEIPGFGSRVEVCGPAGPMHLCS